MRPENTLPAFEHALAIGVDALELDVGLTADGVVVINHDQSLSDVTIRDTAPSSPGDPMFPYVGRRIRDLTFAQIQTVDAGLRRQGDADPFLLTQLPLPGTRIPTLAQVCARIERLNARTPVLSVELKTDPTWADADVARLVAAVAEVVGSRGLMGRTRLLGFDWRVLVHARRLAPEAGRVALLEDKTLRAAADWFAGAAVADRRGFGPDAAGWSGAVSGAISVGATVLSPERSITCPELVAEAHRRGLPVTVWTVNDPAEMAAFIELGADAIVTDYPDRLRTVMDARGLPLPPRYRAGSPAYAG
ncbi:MAG: glycerophosphoryl diester phosphodiesterase [Streptosporangiaceae bacterium]|nr:glycerophosphoryl diester phosphodiesterase [Streptosporangiaceae bacterium]